MKIYVLIAECRKHIHVIIAFQGCDIEKGDVVLKSGETIGASEVGLLATVGVTMVKVLEMMIYFLHDRIVIFVNI